MRKLWVLTAVAILLGACNQAKNKKEAQVSMEKCIVLYYSQTGNTQQVADLFAEMLDTEAVSFDVEEPYDGTYDETIQRCREEQRDGILSPLKPLEVDLADYDVVFLGYPVWFGTYARPVMSLLQEYDFVGKTIVPFCTFGSGGLESSVDSLRATCPQATVMDGYGVRAARIDEAPEEVKQFLVNNGYLEGEVEEQPEMGPEQPVGEHEMELFEAACGSYRMPIGTPLSVRSSVTERGTDYLFTVQSKTPDGELIEAQVYITCKNGGVPEFVKMKR